MAGESNIYGAIGEILILDRYGKHSKYVGDRNYDIIIRDQKVDVKTKRTTTIPEPHYLASIADVTKKQECDWYCFVRVHENLSNAWLLGWAPSTEFFKVATYYHMGDVDPTSSYGWHFQEDCWNLPIKDLWQKE